MGQIPIGERAMTNTERAARKREMDARKMQGMRDALHASMDALLAAGRALDTAGSRMEAKTCREAAERALNAAKGDLDAPLVLAADEQPAGTADDLNGYDARQAAYAAQRRAATEAAHARDAARKAQYG